MSDEELIIEAWYLCPKHGEQHHANGIDLAFPCRECALWPAVKVDREELLAMYPKRDDAS